VPIRRQSYAPAVRRIKIINASSIMKHPVPEGAKPIDWAAEAQRYYEKYIGMRNIARDAIDLVEECEHLTPQQVSRKNILVGQIAQFQSR